MILDIHVFRDVVLGGLRLPALGSQRLEIGTEGHLVLSQRLRVVNHDGIDVLRRPAAQAMNTFVLWQHRQALLLPGEGLSGARFTPVFLPAPSSHSCFARPPPLEPRQLGPNHQRDAQDHVVLEQCCPCSFNGDIMSPVERLDQGHFDPDLGLAGRDFDTRV